MLNFDANSNSSRTAPKQHPPTSIIGRLVATRRQSSPEASGHSAEHSVQWRRRGRRSAGGHSPIEWPRCSRDCSPGNSPPRLLFKRESGANKQWTRNGKSGRQIEVAPLQTSWRASAGPYGLLVSTSERDLCAPKAKRGTTQQSLVVATLPHSVPQRRPYKHHSAAQLNTRTQRGDKLAQFGQLGRLWAARACQ